MRAAETKRLERCWRPERPKKAGWRLAAGALLFGVASWMIACAGIPPLEDRAEHTLKPSVLKTDALVEAPQIVDCTLENGQSSKCYQFKFKSNPHGHGGPYCPKTNKEVGGLGVYDGKTNPGLRVLKAALWVAMATDGFEVVDENGSVNIVDPGAGGGGGAPGGPPPGGDRPSGPPPGGGGPPGGGAVGGAACLEASPNDQLELTFLIPANPVLLETPSAIGMVELVGMSLHGVPMNGKPPTVAGDSGGRPGGGGAIPAIDPCGGHMDPAGYYHWHFGAPEMNNLLKSKGIDDVTCTSILQSSTTMIGYAKDGHAIYASKDADGSTPKDLDACQGHTAPTKEHPNGVYHYHVSTTNAPNLPPCLKGAAAKNAFSRQ